MDEGAKTPRELRESLTPRLSLNEMARRIGISRVFMWQLECGRATWPAMRLARFREICAAWRAAPDPRPRKKRKDAGKRHRKFRLKHRRLPRIMVKVNEAIQELMNDGNP